MNPLNLEDNLNPRQLEAVTRTEGPLLVLAGAGTGKTRVITYRIANLVARGVKPESILAVTFTNKAAEEMKERVLNLAGAGADELWVSTFHSFALRVLRNEYKNYDLRWDFSIFDETDQRNLMKQILKEFGLDEKIKPRTALYYIDIAKGRLMGAESSRVGSFFDDSAASGELVEVYRSYQKELKKNNAKDFSDLLLDLIIFFRDYPGALLKYQEQFSHILVDEYQDTNYAQYFLVKELAKKSGNICVVGDDDQAIYSWRGANVDNIKNFEKDWPACTVVTLEENYRSTANILNAATAVINEASTRRVKKLWTRKDGGEEVRVGMFSRDISEAKGIAEEIKNHTDFGYNYKDIAVFYRTNAQSRIFEETFRRCGIPYKIIGGTGFYERKEIKDALAYLYVILNRHDDWHFSRIINLPPRGMGKKTKGMGALSMIASEKGLSLFDALGGIIKDGPVTAPTKKKLARFIEDVERWHDMMDAMPGFEFVKKVLEESGYVPALEASESFDAKDRLQNLQELVNAVKSHEEESGQSIRDFLYDISLIRERDGKNFSKKGVSLMTLHLCKGLEFPVVFLTGMEEGLLPYGDDFSDASEMEEERRLCYVGMTRAKEVLSLTSSMSRRLWGRWIYHTPSRFLKDTGLVK
ncbi:MAG: UvrD-helicase domain-containing protein [Elusimicrobiota bacterium]|nr:UvrD-helicase domain-containing protein [Elusimicrobiota bacterium]